MKKYFFLVLSVILILACSSEEEKREITLSNPLDENREAEYVEIDLSRLEGTPDDLSNLSVSTGDSLIPFQSVGEDRIALATNFSPFEEKIVSIDFNGSESMEAFEPGTYAEIAMKINYEKKDGKYSGGEFQTFDSVRVPNDHTDHNALFKYEGPGWESEKVGYRMYIDWRNRIDIFGKKSDELVLQDVGIDDRDAKDDSYHEMQPWGMDILKVGNTLGIGTFAMKTDNGFQSVEKRDSVIVRVTENGPVKSNVKVNYYGWIIEDEKYDLEADLSITAGSRLTKSDLKISDNAESILTGLAKYPGTEFLKDSTGNGWSFIGLYGEQALSGDDLGIAIFFNEDDLIEQTEDDENYLIELKPKDGKVKYYFAAAWIQEKEGITNIEEFNNYLNETIQTLNNPIKVEYNLER